MVATQINNYTSGYFNFLFINFISIKLIKTGMLMQSNIHANVGKGIKKIDLNILNNLLSYSYITIYLKNKRESTTCNN